VSRFRGLAFAILAESGNGVSTGNQLMKRYRIIIEQVGSKIVEAETTEDAIDEFGADVTGDELLQMLSINAEEVP